MMQFFIEKIINGIFLFIGILVDTLIVTLLWNYLVAPTWINLPILTVELSLSIGLMFTFYNKMYGILSSYIRVCTAISRYSKESVEL